jgi:putative methyltransferase (TIGR04325 family)
MLANLNESSAILDFGGGAGTHFDSLKQLYPQLNLEYYVVETEIMSMLAGKARSNDTHLHFKTIRELPEINPKIQLLIANSSLQYTKNPLSVLSKLLALSPELVFITRCPLTQSKNGLSINQISRLNDNGPLAKNLNQDAVVEYTAEIVPYSDFKLTLQREYSIILEVKEEHSPFGADYPDIDSWGFICRSN